MIDPEELATWVLWAFVIGVALIPACQRIRSMFIRWKNRRRMRREFPVGEMTINGKPVYRNGKRLRAGDIKAGEVFQFSPSGDHYVLSGLSHIPDEPIYSAYEKFLKDGGQ